MILESGSGMRARKRMLSHLQFTSKGGDLELRPIDHELRILLSLVDKVGIILLFPLVSRYLGTSHIVLVLEGVDAGLSQGEGVIGAGTPGHTMGLGESCSLLQELALSLIMVYLFQ